jgi:hypothetical protein
LSRDNLAGIDFALLEEARSSELEGDELVKFVAKHKKQLAKDMNVTVRVLERMQREAEIRAAAAVKAKGETLSKAFQAKHASRVGRGKNKRGHGKNKKGQGSGKSSRKLGRLRFCDHPEHDT